MGVTFSGGIKPLGTIKAGRMFSKVALNLPQVGNNDTNGLYVAKTENEVYFFTWAPSSTDMLTITSSHNTIEAWRVMDYKQSCLFINAELPVGTYIEMWGGGGGADRSGLHSGRGGFSKGTLTQSLINPYIGIGQGGFNMYGCDAFYPSIQGTSPLNVSTHNVGGGSRGGAYGCGGGCSGLFSNDAFYGNSSTSYLIAGGGGGGNTSGAGGGDGGGISGRNGSRSAGGRGGYGGTQTSGNGFIFAGNPYGCTAGSGGGWRGGTKAIGVCNGNYGGGGGGSGYIDSFYVSGDLYSGNRYGGQTKYGSITTGSLYHFSTMGSTANTNYEAKSHWHGGAHSPYSAGHGAIVISLENLD